MTVSLTPSYAVRRGFGRAPPLLNKFKELLVFEGPIAQIEKLRNFSLREFGPNYIARLDTIRYVIGKRAVEMGDDDAVAFLLQSFGHEKLYVLLRDLFGPYHFSTEPKRAPALMNRVPTRRQMQELMALTRVSPKEFDRFFSDGVVEGLDLTRPSLTPLISHMMQLFLRPDPDGIPYVFFSIFDAKRDLPAIEMMLAF